MTREVLFNIFNIHVVYSSFISTVHLTAFGKLGAHNYPKKLFFLKLLFTE